MSHGKTKHLATAADFDEVENSEEGLSSAQRRALKRHGATNLDDESDPKRLYDSDEADEADDDEVDMIASSSDSSSDDEQVDAAPETETNGGGGGSSDDEDFEVGGEDDDVDDKKPKASNKRAPNERTANDAEHNKKMQRAQADLKRKRTEAQKDPERTEAAFNDYACVATWQASQGAPDLRKQILESNITTGRVGQLARSVVEIESLVTETLTLAERATPALMREIIDFVKNASALEDGDRAYTASATRCDVSQLPGTGDELVCLKALHDKRPTPIWKRKVVLVKLRPLVEAVWVAVNLLAIAEQMVVARLQKIKAFKNGETTVNEAVRLITEDPTQNAVKKQLRTKLTVALNKIDMSAKLVEQKK